MFGYLIAVLQEANKYQLIYGKNYWLIMKYNILIINQNPITSKRFHNNKAKV